MSSLPIPGAKPATHVPLGVARPIRVNGEYADGSHYVPFAPTVPTLVWTHQAGMQAITDPGGANTHVVADYLHITSCLVLADTCGAMSFVEWLRDRFGRVQAVVGTTARGLLAFAGTNAVAGRSD